MKRLLLIPTLTVVAACGAVPTAQADGYDGYDQEPGIAKCFYKLPKKLSLKQVARHGFTVTAGCDRDTRVSVALDFKSAKQHVGWTLLHNGGVPPIGDSTSPRVAGGGTAGVHVVFKAAKYARRYKRIPLIVMLGRTRPSRPNVFAALDGGQAITLTN